MLIFFRRYLILILLVSLATKSICWNNNSFYIDSRLPKSCGQMKIYSPEAYFVSRETWPWLGILSYSDSSESKCRCILIHPQACITGALCIPPSGLFRDKNLFIVFSLPGLPSYKKATVSDIDFSKDDDHSVALLKFEKPITLSNNVQPICLWEKNIDYSSQLDRIAGLIIGSDTASSGNEIRTFQASVQVIGQERCKRTDPNFYELVLRNKICVLYNRGIPKCHFIGAALMFPRVTEEGDIAWYLRGVQTDRQSYCSDGQFSPIYDLAAQKDWIKSHFRAPIGISCGRRAVGHTELIINGEMSTRGDFPWHAGIFWNELNKRPGVYKCGGSLIHPLFVLTAGHCVVNQAPLSPQLITVLLGKYDIFVKEPGAILKEVVQVIPHEQFNRNSLMHDIALLKFDKEVIFNQFVQPVCLWDESDTRKEKIYNKMGRVPGWGIDGNNKLTSKLNVASIPVIEDVTCIRSHDVLKSFNNNMTFCAGSPGKNASVVCNGDSGGGFVISYKQSDQKFSWVLRGIVSVTVAREDFKLCDPEQYTIYTDVAKYLPWIRSNTPLQ